MEFRSMFRLRGTVICSIWRHVLMMAVYTAIIAYLHNYVAGMRMNFPQTLVPILGVVTGFLLVFRTNTAYDRYWEGKKIWSTLTLAIRNLTRCIWVMVKDKKPLKDGASTDGDSTDDTSKEIVSKISAINLLLAFPYATKKFIREGKDKNDLEEDDFTMKKLISHLPKFYIRIQAEDCKGALKSKKYKEDSDTAQDMVNPIELSYYIASYIKSIEDNQLANSSTITIMNNALTSLVDCITGFERIVSTPIPFSYSVHLNHAVWLYLLALPFQLVEVLNWFTIPAVTLASFALLGLLSIGLEIENPFGRDKNDLPVDNFCRVIQKEIQSIIGGRIPKLETWIFSEENHPLVPDSEFTAAELSKMDEEQIRGILATTATSSIYRLSGKGSKVNESCKGIVVDSNKLTAEPTSTNGVQEEPLISTTLNA